MEIKAGTTGWLSVQTHAGENIGDTDTHVIFVELKGSHSPSSMRAKLVPDAHGPGM